MKRRALTGTFNHIKHQSIELLMLVFLDFLLFPFFIPVWLFIDSARIMGKHEQIKFIFGDRTDVAKR